MVKIENTEVVGWEATIRGMRNPLNSWDRSDSTFLPVYAQPADYVPEIGENDQDLMRRLCKGGPVHAKFRRMIIVYVDITAPLYWWKEFDTYKVGTTANSCSTMHKIHAKEFTLDDFSHEHLNMFSLNLMELIIRNLNTNRKDFVDSKDKDSWWQMIQILPTSYNQKRTVELNYEVLNNIYHSRRHHKLDEWHTICDWIENLPYSWIITGEENENGKTR